MWTWRCNFPFRFLYESTVAVFYFSVSHRQLTQLIYPDQNDLNYGRYRWHIATSTVTDCKQRVCLWFVPLLSFPTKFPLSSSEHNLELAKNLTNFPKPVEKKGWVTYQVRKNEKKKKIVHFEIKLQIFSVYNATLLKCDTFFNWRKRHALVLVKNIVSNPNLFGGAIQMCYIASGHPGKQGLLCHCVQTAFWLCRKADGF